MLNKSRETKLGVFLAFILRHKPEAIGMTLDENGWADVSVITSQTQEPMTLEELQTVVANDRKGRYVFNEDGTKVRAAQGHSVDIDVQLKEAVNPPETLFHGTTEDVLDKILVEGLTPQSRLYVHLSIDTETATKVGQRHGKVVLLAVSTKALIEAGYPIFVSENGVYQSKFVPANFLARV